MDENLEMEARAAVPADIKITCPKCGFRQAPGEECRRCGIIFNKFVRKRPESEIAQDQQAACKPDQIVAKAQAEALFYSMENRKSRVSYRQLFKWLRISALFLILVFIGAYSMITSARMTSWDAPRHIVIFPINWDASDEVYDYLELLNVEVFKPVEKFMRSEAKYYEIGIENPVIIDLGPEIESFPPEPPASQNPFYVMLWSLKFRYWAFKNTAYDGPCDVRIFILYRKAATDSLTLERSLGLKKGFIALVRAPAYKWAEPYTNFIIAHEMLHTFGAFDKYDRKTLFPRYPEGFAEPELKPLFPQTMAEIMGGSIPLRKGLSAKLKNLDQAVIGEETAREIKWIKEEKAGTKE